LESVAYVVEFEADTPLELIKAVSPDVLIKGADYKPGEVVGGDIVEAAGGRVVTPLFVPDVSTTNIVDRILSSALSRNPKT
jgi:D-beta-D-heptose 7-phosphate kinase/D-beta-D-heptose 1-phosphate adenosyltransferase